MKITTTYCDICDKVLRDHRGQFEPQEDRGRLRIATECFDLNNPLRHLPGAKKEGNMTEFVANEVCEACLEDIAESFRSLVAQRKVTHATTLSKE